MPEGYCTVSDVRRAIQDTVDDFDSGAWGEDDNRIAVDAIESQNEWLRSKTDRHWYEPDGVDDDEHDLIPTEARDREGEEKDVPSTPHPQHSQLFVHRRGRYPRKVVGPYTRVRLDKHYVEEVTALEVRDTSGGFEDWTEADEKVEDEDWRLYVEPGSASSPSYVDLHVSSLPALQHYTGAVRVSYEYGDEGIPGTVRRAIAMRAAAQLLTDDEASLGIPDNGQLVNPETKVQTLERQAEELLEVYL